MADGVDLNPPEQPERRQVAARFRDRGGAERLAFADPQLAADHVLIGLDVAGDEDVLDARLRTFRHLEDQIGAADVAGHDRGGRCDGDIGGLESLVLVPREDPIARVGHGRAVVGKPGPESLPLADVQAHELEQIRARDLLVAGDRHAPEPDERPFLDDD